MVGHSFDAGIPSAQLAPRAIEAGSGLAPSPRITETSFIEIRGLRVVYRIGARERVALDGVDLFLPRGQFLCVRGKSGSGKSSLLHVLGALIDPQAGSVRVGGTEITHLSRSASALYRRRRCGVIFQAFNLLDMLTVAENIGFPLGLDGTSQREIDARVDALLEEVGLLERRNDFPDQLSGGEQQRIAIARALAIRPDVILADEPTGNLDSESGIRIWATLRDLSRSHGATIVMVTHDPDATAYANRVVELRDGRIVADTGAFPEVATERGGA
jgi:putative ABC transport system ATP-binding protein